MCLRLSCVCNIMEKCCFTDGWWIGFTTPNEAKKVVSEFVYDAVLLR